MYRSLFFALAAVSVLGLGDAYAFTPADISAAPTVTLVDLNCTDNHQQCIDAAREQKKKCSPYIPYNSPRNYRPTQWCLMPAK